MIYYLFITTLCISTITFCADPRRNADQKEFIPSWMRELIDPGNTTANRTTADRKQNEQEDIIGLLAMRNAHSIIRRESYSLENRYGKISETRINPTTGLAEQRSFTHDDVAHVSFDNPNLTADIILKR